MAMAGQHLIIDAHFKNKSKMNDKIFIDKILIKATEVAGMTIAVPPISLKFPVDKNIYKTFERISELNTLKSGETELLMSRLKNKDNGELGGYGVSGTAIWVESHLSIHTWTENDNFVSIDMYSCKNLDFTRLLDFFKNELELSDGTYTFLTRYKDKLPSSIQGIF